MIFEVVTRHTVGRVGFLAANMDSVKAMSGNVLHTLLPDTERRGVAWANERLRSFEPTGDHVWVLDDDDLCICPSLARCIAVQADLYEPDMIMLRMDHGAPLGVLPDHEHWRQAPKLGYFGCSSFVVSRAHWLTCRDAWGARYEGDYDFIAHAYREAKAIIWHDCVASRCQRRGSEGAL